MISASVIIIQGKQMRWINRGKVFLVMVMCLCISASDAFASLEGMICYHAWRLHSYTTGTLLYDSSVLEARYGPGFHYETDDRFEMEKGSKVRVMTITEENGYAWALVEGEAENEQVWIYLLCKDPVRGTTIEIDDPSKVLCEPLPDYSSGDCGIYESAIVRLGPGENYPAMKTNDFESWPVVVGIYRGWVLLEYQLDESFMRNGDKEIWYYRGWVSIHDIDQF